MGGLEERVNKSFLDTAKNLFSEHYPKLVGLATAAATYITTLELGYFFRGVNAYEEVPFLFSAPPVFGYLGFKVTDYHKRLRAYKKRFNLETITPVSEKKPYKPKSRNFLDRVLEHPQLMGLAATIPICVGIYNFIGDWREDPNLKNSITLAFLTPFIPLEYALGNIVGRFLSVLFHSENIGVTLQMPFTLLYGNLSKFGIFREKYRERLERIIQTSPYPSAYFDLASMEAEDERFDEAFPICIEGLRLLEERRGLPYATWNNWFPLSDNIVRFESLSSCERALKKNPKPANYLQLVPPHLRLNNPDGAINVLDDLSEKHEHLAPHAGVLKVRILDKLERKEEATQELKDLFAILRAKEEYKEEKMGEGHRDVYVFGPSDFIKGSIVFRESNSLRDFEFETDVIRSLEKIVSDHPMYRLPHPLGEVFSYEHNGKERFVYAERFIPSQSLLQILEKEEKIDENTFSILENVTDFLALIHAQPELASKSEKGRINLPHKLNDRLSYEWLGCPRTLAHKIVYNSHPVLVSFQDAIYVLNKDAHQDNWRIGADGTIKLVVIAPVDFEDKGVVPIQLDLVNVFEYGVFLTLNQKDKLINSYIDSFNNYSGEEVITDREKFKLTYFNAVVPKAVSLTSAWSSPDRESLWPRRRVVLENAIKAIGEIKSRYFDYYRHYTDNYENLKEALIELRELLPVQSNN